MNRKQPTYISSNIVINPESSPIELSKKNFSLSLLYEMGNLSMPNVLTLSNLENLESVLIQDSYYWNLSYVLGPNPMIVNTSVIESFGTICPCQSYDSNILSNQECCPLVYVSPSSKIIISFTNHFIDPENYGNKIQTFQDSATYYSNFQYDLSVWLYLDRVNIEVQSELFPWNE